MRVAVLGAGSAGHMAVAQVSRYVPDAQVTHFYDPSTPPIGVGEGTTPAFTEWARRVLGWDFDFLARHCDATAKAGIVFEGWGTGGTYTHFFGTAEGRACHLSAAMLAEQLARRSNAEVISERVHSMDNDGTSASIETEHHMRTFDFVLDARGFPDELDDTHLPFDCVSTSAALLARGPVRAPRDRTRAVARPHGWVFVIPLGSDTAYGYIHDADDSTEAERDFERFFSEEAVEPQTPVRTLRFPNYRSRQLVDGPVIRIGNRAAFIEPLEATSLGLIVLQLQAATYLMLSWVLGSFEQAPAIVDKQLGAAIDEAASFVGWHYARGSAYDTPFWRRGEAGFESWLGMQDAEHRGRFDRYVERGRSLPGALAHARSIPEVDELLPNEAYGTDTFGGFLDVSFAKVGTGIGWY